MELNFRIKVLGHTVKELSRKGFAVSGTGCKPGELWIVGASRIGLDRACKRHDINTITELEAINV